VLALLNEFVVRIQAREFERAMELSRQVLEIEPDNRLIQRYQPILEQFLKDREMLDMLNDSDGDEEEDGGDEEEEEDEEGGEEINGEREESKTDRAG